MVEKQSQFNDLARQVLSEYGLRGYNLHFIRHSDNVTFKVNAPSGGEFLLRLHIPITEAMGAHGTDLAMVRSELMWLEALNQQTNLVLQRPVRNQAGDLVTQLPQDNQEVPVNCTLLRWIDGRPYHRDLETEETAYQIGEIMATLHNHASQWQAPKSFQRPKRDKAYFEGVLKEIQPAVEDGRITPDEYALLERAIQLLIVMMDRLEVNQGTHGIIHGDGQKGNMLIHHGRIRLIDFSFCATGHFMFDLGICLSDMNESLHPSFLKGYQSLRPLPEGYQKLIEGFFLGSIVGTFSFWVNNPNAQEILARKLPPIVQTYAARFNRGESFWFASE